MKMPDEKWELDELASYAVKMLAEYRQGPVRMALDVFRMGHALTLARAKLKKRMAWVEWQSQHKLPRPTVNQAIRLCKFFDTEDDLNGMTIMEAKRAAGILKDKPKPKPPVWVPADAPRVMLRLERSIHAVDTAMKAVKEDLETMDRESVAKLAESLAELAREAAKMAGRGSRVKVASH